MKKQLFFFLVKFVIGLLLVFGLHVFILRQLNISLNYLLLNISYLVNFLMVFFIVAILGMYINKFKSYIGFLFLFGSFFKFAVFFAWFYPIIKADGKVENFEFGLFFIPYFIGLLFETYELSKILNKV